MIRKIIAYLKALYPEFPLVLKSKLEYNKFKYERLIDNYKNQERILREKLSDYENKNYDKS